MEDFKKNWPDKLFKIIISILSIIFGTHEYHIHQAAKEIPVVPYIQEQK